MEFDLFLTLCNYIGTIAFAASGVIKGFKHNLDAFGLTVLAIVTACGGGMIRDMMLSQIPAALTDPKPLYLSILVTYLMYLFVTRKREITPRDKTFIKYLAHLNLVFDAIGLAIFALIGASKGISMDLNIFASGLLATLTGVGGGIIRDLLVNETPFVLKEDIYAVLAFLAGTLFHILVVFLQLPQIMSYLLVFSLALIIRLLVIRYKINLPNLERNHKNHRRKPSPSLEHDMISDK